MFRAQEFASMEILAMHLSEIQIRFSSSFSQILESKKISGIIRIKLNWILTGKKLRRAFMIYRMSAVNARTKLKPLPVEIFVPPSQNPRYREILFDLHNLWIMELVPRGWNELGVSNIIYEEGEDDDSSSIPSLSPDSTASSTPENRRVKAW